MKNRILCISLAVVLVLSVGLIGCGGEVVPEYSLAISSTEGGSVTSPREPGPYSYDEGKVVNLVAEAEEGYEFVNWTGDVDDVADTEDSTTTITMNGDYSITAEFAIKQYDLNIGSTEGGSVATPGEGTYTYDEGTVVDLVAQPDEGYQFTKWTGSVGAIADVYAAETTITIDRSFYIYANFAKEIWDWHDLDAIRDNLNGDYILMNDLDSNTPGYEELASPTANGGKGWEPIGSVFPDQDYYQMVDSIDQFSGHFYGQGCEIRSLFIHRPDEDNVGLFGYVGEGTIENLGVVNAKVTGRYNVGGLMGGDHGAVVSNSYSTSSVSGQSNVGGLVGYHSHGLRMATVNNSYSTSSVNGGWNIGGLVGWNHYGTVRNSHSTGNVAGQNGVGGLVGANWHGTVINSHYDYDEVLINGKNIITIGVLFDEDFEQWLADSKFLDVNERLPKQDGYYLITNVDDFKQLITFGQDGSLKFRLTNDLDLDSRPNFYIPYFAGEFDGNGHKISNLGLNFDSVSQVGLFGYLAFGGKVIQVNVENLDIITGGTDVGGLVGFNDGTLSDSYSTGSVAGGSWVGGLVGTIHDGTVSNSYSSCSATAQWGAVGGLVGWHFHGIVSNSYYDYNEVLINGKNIITVGALFDEDFEQWLDNNKFLDINERLSKEDGYYLIDSISDFKQLLAFGQDESLKFRLESDLDLGNEANFYIPHLAGEFDGNGHKISNLGLNFNCISQVGLFGHLTSSGRINQVGVESVNIIADTAGGLVGYSLGTIRNSYASGSVSGRNEIGGLGGHSRGIVSNCHFTGSVTGETDVGGLLGSNFHGTVSNSYSTGSVTGKWQVGGLVGRDMGTVSNSFWDTQTSGQTDSAGGTGKTTEEMQDIATFTGAGWNIVAVANPDMCNPFYIWNIVDGLTYPFLSWEHVS